MTIKELSSLKEQDLVKNISALRATVGVSIPENTTHVVIKWERFGTLRLLHTTTVDEAQVRCVFTEALALQLLQKYDSNPL